MNKTFGVAKTLLRVLYNPYDSMSCGKLSPIFPFFSTLLFQDGNLLKSLRRFGTILGQGTLTSLFFSSFIVPFHYFFHKLSTAGWTSGQDQQTGRSKRAGRVTKRKNEREWAWRATIRRRILTSGIQIACKEANYLLRYTSSDGGIFSWIYFIVFYSSLPYHTSVW